MKIFPWSRKKRRAAVVIIRDGKILLMYRRNPWRGEYFLIPGGMVDKGEGPEGAALREAKEETGFDVVIDRLLFRTEDGYGEHFVYAVHPVSGEAVLGGEEAGFHSETDFYRLDWVLLKELANTRIVSDHVKERLVDILGLAGPDKD